MQPLGRLPLAKGRKPTHSIRAPAGDSRQLHRTCRQPRLDYLSLLDQRTRRWSKPVGRTLWPFSINNKLLGYLFALSVGVRTPQILFCSRSLAGLPAAWPRAWGRRFAVKPLFGTNSRGVVLVNNGIDVMSGRPARGRADVEKIYADRSWQQLERGRTIYVEELVSSSSPWSSEKPSPPDDFKFLTFGRNVGAAYVATGRGSNDYCIAWVDAAFRRVDRAGCARTRSSSTSPGFLGPPPERSPSCGAVRRPPGWDALLGAARKLGRAIGVHYRVDLLYGRQGVVLSEFTPLPFAGKFHCANPRANGSVDACHLGRLWQDGGEEGGVVPPVPEVLRPWWPGRYNEFDAQCHLVKRMQRSANRSAHRPSTTAYSTSLQ